MTFLCTKNKHELDDRIRFQEKGHKYWIDNDSTDVVSVTTYIKSFFEEFDTDRVISGILKKYEYHNDPSYKYYKMDPEVIKYMWEKNRDESSGKGTDLHKNIEDFYNNLYPDDDSIEFQYFLNFYKEHNDKYEIYRTEFLVFSEILKITGSIDALFQNIDNETFSIFDWKRSKEIKKVSYMDKKGKFPMDNILDCNYYHYSLQLNLYRILLERFYNIHITELFLVILHPDNSNYLKISVNIMEDDAELLLLFRIKELLEKGYQSERFESLEFLEKNKLKIEKIDEKRNNLQGMMTSNNNYDNEDDDIVIVPLLKKKNIEVPEEKKVENNLSNKGKKWSEEDDKTLMESVKNEESIENLSLIYKRSCGAIKLRIIHNVLKETINDEDIMEYCESIPQIKYTDVIEYKNKLESEKVIQKDKKKIDSLDKLKYKPIKGDLSEKQQQAYNLIMKGKNVFITSPGGYGKSYLIKKIAYEFRSLKIGVTSTTGTSAILIGGTTIHSFLGIGLGNASVEKLYMMIKNKSYICKRWKELDVLIIDEISMLDPALFDKLEQLARTIRKNDEVFGGIQLILSGDFFQLPVVQSEFFCFDATCWNECVPREHIIQLDINFRQDDNEFQRILNEIRRGDVSDETMEILRTREDAILENSYGIIATKIFALNRDVDEYNEKAINELCFKNPDLEFFQYDLTYDIIKKSMKNFDFEEKLRKNCNVPMELQLCVGVQVMLLYNLDLENGLCNGSRGVVIGFDAELPVVKFLNGKTVLINYNTWTIEENCGEPILMYSQIPLRISYAITAHRSQGLSIDYAEVSLDNIFADGQAYVSLSRVRTLDGLCIRNLNRECFRCNSRVLEFYNSLNEI